MPIDYAAIQSQLHILSGQVLAKQKLEHERAAHAVASLIRIGFLIAYMAIIIGVVFQPLPLWFFLVFLTIPLSIDAFKHASPYDDGSYCTPAMTRAIAM